MNIGVTYSDLGRMGRFGNQLFQIASTIGLSFRERLPYAFGEWEYEKYFENALPKRDPKGFYKSYVGYLQDYRNFKWAEPIIQQQFKLKPREVEIPENTVFIHFRAYSKDLLGDVTAINPEQTTDYYLRAIKYFPNKQFVVFTDNIEIAKKVIYFLDCPFVCSENFIDDFYVMTKCDGGIISNSSFAWWAGWLSNKKIIIPKIWFTEKATYPTEGYYLPEWLSL